MKLNKKTEEEEEEDIDAVLIFPSEDFHRFDCNLGLEIEISPSY